MTLENLVGLKFDFANSMPILLGRQSSLRSRFAIQDNDRIAEITVTCTTNGQNPEIIGIQFRTENGFCSELMAGEKAHSREVYEIRNVILKSSSALILVGLAWSFDLGPLRPGCQGVQPIYKLQEGLERTNLQEALYPSLKWATPPPPNLQLRPVPAMQSNNCDFDSLVYPKRFDNQKISKDATIVSIEVFFNCFVQGIRFTYADSSTSAVGNILGSSRKVELDTEEVIFSVQLYERIRSLVYNAVHPREVVCIEGIAVNSFRNLKIKKHIC